MQSKVINTIKKTKETTMRYLFLFVLQLNYIYGLKIRSCTAVDSHKSIEKAIKNQDSSIILFCPFQLSNFKTVDITRPNISIVCSKEKNTDKCVINSSWRHFNILADRVTFIGFDFHNSKSAAVRVRGDGTSLIDCTFKE